MNPGDAAIVPEPGYQAYLGGAILAGADPYIAALRPENDFLLDLEQVPEAVLRRAKLVFVNYPNNPTAAVATPEYLERTVAICRRYGILLAYDNAYCDLTYDGYRAPSIFEFPGARDVALEFFSLSKSFSMTGWRIGFAVGRPELITALTRVKSYTDTGPFLAVQKAGAATLDQAEAIVEPIRAELEVRRDAAVAALREAGFVLEAPKAAMYLWVALPAGTHVGRVCQARDRGDRHGGAAGQRLRSGGRRLLPHRPHGRGGPAAAGRGPPGPDASGAPSRRACPGYLKPGCRPRGAGRGSRSRPASACTACCSSAGSRAASRSCRDARPS